MLCALKARLGRLIKYCPRVFDCFLNNTVYFHASKGRKAVPRYLYIEIANICNANCIFCAYQYDRRARRVIDQDIFYRAVNSYKTMGGRRVGLTPHFGEIFVDPDILNKIRYIHQTGFESIHTYTNASLLHKFGFKDILCSGLTSLNISTAPLIREVYQKIYRNNNYENVRSNIEKLLVAFRALQAQERSGLTVKEISIEFRADRPVAECVKAKDYVDFVKPHISKNVFVRGFSSFDAWSGAIKQEDLLKGMNLKSAAFPKIFPCARVFTVQIEVNGNARICGCRMDTTKDVDDLYIGNIKDNSLEELYNSKRAQKIIGSFIRNDLLDICKKCSWYEI